MQEFPIWPVVPGNNAAIAISLAYQLEKSQWWPVEKLSTIQTS